MLYIFVGSTNDKKFLTLGDNYLFEENISHNTVYTSVHREPNETKRKLDYIFSKKNLSENVLIAGAATATGLPGYIAGYCFEKELNITVLGVRFTKTPSQILIDEDRAFGLSSMPSGPSLAYAGFNEQGFLNACKLAAFIINIKTK